MSTLPRHFFHLHDFWGRQQRVRLWLCWFSGGGDREGFEFGGDREGYLMRSPPRGYWFGDDGGDREGGGVGQIRAFLVCSAAVAYRKGEVRKNYKREFANWVGMGGAKAVPCERM